jgi:hypothetical protein
MFNIDITSHELHNLERAIQEHAEKILQETAAALAAQTYGHAVELAQDTLHSSRDTYLQSLELKQIDENTWSVMLHPEAMWIEEGMSRHEMIDDLLFGKNGRTQVTTAKDGMSQYKVIPFKVNKAPNASTAATRELQSILKKTFKEQNITYGKKEVDADGKPLTGTLHKLDILDKPLKTANGPGQGLGNIGDVKQGMSGIPWLKGVNVIQRQLRGGDGKIRTSRDIMTFRIVSTKQRGTGRWVHPGIEGKKIIDKTFAWASNQWNQEMKPQMIEEIAKLHSQS